VTMQIQRNAAGLIQAVARFHNTGSVPLSGAGLQAAVPKTQKLQLLPIASEEIGPPSWTSLAHGGRQHPVTGPCFGRPGSSCLLRHPHHHHSNRNHQQPRANGFRATMPMTLT
ncbi:hypothetical protein EWS82_13080, partial [Staphylococcus xylosus]|nr:hypothetical protein [Staphylococcus xylosus]